MSYGDGMNKKHIAFHIRQATPKDAHSLAVLIREAALSDKIKHESLPETLIRIEKSIQNCGDEKGCNIFIVADSEESILAYAAIQWHTTLFLPGNEGYVSELTVKAATRGHGIGSMLLDKLIEEGRNRNCARISLINSQFRDSYKREFYNKRGWYERKEAANFIYEF